jgi:hypothetical protein
MGNPPLTSSICIISQGFDHSQPLKNPKVVHGKDRKKNGPFSSWCIIPGWWFATFFIFPYIGNNNN